MKTGFFLGAVILIAGCAANHRNYTGAPAAQHGWQTDQRYDDQFPYRSGPGLPSTDRQIPARSGPGGIGPDR